MFKVWGGRFIRRFSTTEALLDRLAIWQILGVQWRRAYLWHHVSGSQTFSTAATLVFARTFYPLLRLVQIHRPHAQDERPQNACYIIRHRESKPDLRITSPTRWPLNQLALRYKYVSPKSLTSVHYHKKLAQLPRQNLIIRRHRVVDFCKSEFDPCNNTYCFF